MNNLIQVPPNSFKLINLFGLTKSIPGAETPLSFIPAMSADIIKGHKLLIKSVKAFYSLAGTDNTIANKIITNAAKEVTGYEIINDLNAGFIPRDSVAFKPCLGLVRLLINGKSVLFTDSIHHPMFDLDNLGLFVDDPVNTFQFFVSNIVLSKGEGTETTDDLNAFVELGVYVL